MSTVLDELPLKGSHDDENVARPAVSLRTWLPICWSWILRINCLALLLAAIVLRCWELGTIPGINGDEAWYGVQVMQILHGEAFSFTTPTGNLANPFYFLPLLALHSVFEPSFTLLRVVALVSGLAALLVNYWLCNKTFGRKSAVVSTLILAILPINIAYSRFGWDTSQSLLFTLPPIYLSLLAMLQPARRVSFTVWTIVSFAAAIVVHPTNLLIAPWLLVMLVYAWRDRIQQILPTWQKKGIVSLILLTAALMALGGRLAPLIERTHDAAQFGLFTKHLGHLFSGVSTYEFISGSMLNSVGNPDPASPERIHSDAAMIVVLALVAWPLYRRVRKKEPLDICLLAAWLSTIIGFYLVAGPAAIAPHFERYAICLIAPTVVLATQSLVWWMQSTTRCAALAAPYLIVIAWCVLAFFYQEYFQQFQVAGGNSHRTFRTAAVEPKQAALQAALSTRSPHETSLQLATTEWWLYWPLRYLSFNDPGVSIIHLNQQQTSVAELERLLGQSVRCIEFSDSEIGRRLSSLKKTGLSSIPPGEEKANTVIAEIPIQDAGGRILINVYWMPKPAGIAASP